MFPNVLPIIVGYHMFMSSVGSVGCLVDNSGFEEVMKAAPVDHHYL